MKTLKPLLVALSQMCVVLLLVSGPATAGEPVISEPIKCYLDAGGVPGGMTVGLSVELCSGTTDADKTIQCFVKAFEPREYGGLGLPLGLAVQLCKANSQPLS